MADEPFKIGQGATRPLYAVELLDAAGAPIPLTNASSVHLHMRKVGGGALVDRAAAIVSPATLGQVVVTWQAGDTAESGTYKAYFWITWSTGATERVPSGEELEIVVKAAV